MTVLLAFLAALAAGAGVHLVYSEVALGRRGLRSPQSAAARANTARRVAAQRDEWLVQAGLADTRWSEFAAVLVALFVVGAAIAFALFGGVLPAIVLGLFAASFPIASSRARRASRLATAQDSWPRMIEELRIQTSALGRSIPQALFEVGRRGPVELRDAFEAAHREWLISTDFERTLAVLKQRLADPTADATCETLLIAHELGGSDLDRRLTALIEDRVLDAQGRKDARAKQSGVRFARRFVLLVPLGMALAGMSVGNGRVAYQTASGQLMVLAGIAMVVACWVWAAQLMKLPEEQRVFSE
jgi:tight adherence protein B